MEQVDKTTYKQVAGDLEAVVGDEKQKKFFPRLKIKKWDNEVNFSVGLKDASGQHKIVDDKVIYKSSSGTAEFYPIQAAKKPKFDTRHIRFINSGKMSPEQVAARYEIDRYFDWPAQTIMYHIPDRPSMMYYGYYHRASFIDEKKIDLPQCRVAATGPLNNPMYMDSGLLLIDIHYDQRRDDLDKIRDSITQAATDVIKSYGIKVTQKPGKLYFTDGSKQVKFFSGAFIDGHYYFYINMDCDYNKAYDYYKTGTPKNIRDQSAYGLRSVKPDLPDSIAVEVVQQYAKLYGLPLVESKLTASEQNKLDQLTKYHSSDDWISKAQRDDVYKFNREEQTEGFEFSFTLKNRPRSNIVPLTIEAKELRFFYQSELSQKEALSNLRPNNVVGSYTVYHASKQNNDYLTGKAFHIFRPWAEDDTGNRVWCDLNIDLDDNGYAKKDEIEIIVPQSFLDSAKYPVLIDPTFGYTTIGASVATITNGTATDTGIYTLLNQVAGETGLGASMSAYVTVASSGNTVSYKMAIYNSTSSLLVGQTTTASFTSNQSAAWSTLNFNTITATDQKPTTPYVRNLAYDLAIWSNNTATAYEVVNINYDTQTNASKEYSNAGNLALAAWPQNISTGFSSTTTTSRRFSIYTTYTAVTAPTIYRLSEQDLSNTSATTSVTTTYPSTPIQNNLLVAVVWSNRPSGNNAISGWTNIIDQGINSNVTSVTLFAKIAGAGEATAVQATAASAAVMHLYIYEYTGNVTASVAAAQDAAAASQAVASATSAATPSISTATANDLLFTVCGFTNQAWTASASWNNSFNMIGATNRLLIGERLVTATSSYSSTASWTTSRPTGTIIASFKAASIASSKKLGSLGVG